MSPSRIRPWALLLFLALALAAGGHAGDRFTVAASKLHLDATAPARTLDPQAIAAILEEGEIARCAVFAGRKGVRTRAEVTFLDLFGDTPIPIAGEEAGGRTRRNGWTAASTYAIPPELEPAGAIVVDAQLAGGKPIEDVISQCSIGTPSECLPSETTGCISTGGNSRFQVELDWTDFFDGSQRRGRVGRMTDDGLFFFLAPTNFELLVQILDNCDDADFNSFSVFYTAATEVEFTLRVTDTASGVVRRYDDRIAPAEPITDISAFATCP